MGESLHANEEVFSVEDIETQRENNIKDAMEALETTQKQVERDSRAGVIFATVQKVLETELETPIAIAEEDEVELSRRFRHTIAAYELLMIARGEFPEHTFTGFREGIACLEELLVENWESHSMEGMSSLVRSE